MGAKKKKASGNPVNGEKTFKNLCAVCHSLSANSVGPALGATFGSNIASGDGFQYSGALASKATLKWSEANLDKWLQSPAGFAPGNAMAFAGIPNAKDRSDLIAFLKGGWTQWDTGRYSLEIELIRDPLKTQLFKINKIEINFHKHCVTINKMGSCVFVGPGVLIGSISSNVIIFLSHIIKLK